MAILVRHPAEDSPCTTSKERWADKEQVVAVIDIDSTVTSAFDDEDRTALEALANILGAACDW